MTAVDNRDPWHEELQTEALAKREKRSNLRLNGDSSGANSEYKLAALIEEFNEQYAVVNEAGKAMVYEEVKDPVLNRNVLTRITFADLKKLYQNRLLEVPKAGGGTITKTAADWWLNSPRRRQYLKGVVFDPTAKVPDQYWNLWSGYSVEAAQGDWGLMQDHIRKVICGQNDEHAEYLFDWIARTFQQPNQPGEVAIVLRGSKGAGKGVLCSWLVRAWGQHGIHITNAKHLVGNFNAHLRDCVMLFCDEAFYAGDRQHESVLKGLITEATLPIEGKHQNIVQIMNMLHIVMSSNSDWVVPVSTHERRFFILDVLANRIGDRQYFARIAEQMDNGGLAAMIYDMLHRDIAGFEVRNVPTTSALADQKKHSLDSLDRWWLTVLDRGFVWVSRHGASVFLGWHEFYTTELLHRSYLQWCGNNRIAYPMSRVQLGKRMAELYEKRRPRDVHIIGEIEVVSMTSDPVAKAEHQPGYFVNTLDQARARFSEVREVAGEWEN